MGRKPPEKSWKIEPTPILDVCLARTGQNSLPPHRMLWGEFLIQICHIPGHAMRGDKGRVTCNAGILRDQRRTACRTDAADVSISRACSARDGSLFQGCQFSALGISSSLRQICSEGPLQAPSRMAIVQRPPDSTSPCVIESDNLIDPGDCTMAFVDFLQFSRCWPRRNGPPARSPRSSILHRPALGAIVQPSAKNPASSAEIDAFFARGEASR